LTGAEAAGADPLDVLARFLLDASGADDEAEVAEHLALVREHYEAQCREEAVG
jgi:hypothetical protein